MSRKTNRLRNTVRRLEAMLRRAVHIAEQKLNAAHSTEEARLRNVIREREEEIKKHKKTIDEIGHIKIELARIPHTPERSSVSTSRSPGTRCSSTAGRAAPITSAR